VLNSILDTVLVGFLEISYHVTSMTYEVMGVYEGEHPSSVAVDTFEYISRKGGMCVIKVSFSKTWLLSWIKGVVKNHSS